MPGMNPQHDCRQENQYREAEYHRRGRFGPLSHPRPVADDGSPGDKKREGYRQQGYATYVCAVLLQECDQLGYQTFWNCNGQPQEAGSSSG